MAKVETKFEKDKVKIRIKYFFWEKMDFSEYALISTKGYYGLLKPHFVKGASLYYELFTGIRLKDFLAANLSYREVIRVIEQILLVVLETQEIGVASTSLLLELDSVYFNSDNGEVQMICSNDISKGSNNSLFHLIYEILNAYSTKETTNLNFRRRFMDFLDELGSEDIYRIEDFLYKEKKEIVLDAREIYYTRLYQRLSYDQKNLKRIDAIKKDIELKRVKIEDDNCDSTGYMYEDDEPTGLYDENDNDEPTGFYEEKSDNSTYMKVNDNGRDDSIKGVELNNHDNESICPRLVRKVNGEVIYVNKPSFRLGREAGNVDYCISDNRKISRAHADLILRGKQWYIVDLKSKNRTFVNDKALQANIETPLRSGDVIKLDNEEFDFSL